MSQFRKGAMKYQNQPFSRSATRLIVVHTPSWRAIFIHVWQNRRMPLRGGLLLMSFKRHEEIYPNDRGADPNPAPPAHRLDEFPAGYSLTGCSPALPASASPTGIEDG
jgi:hypothetical protein